MKFWRQDFPVPRISGFGFDSIQLILLFHRVYSAPEQLHVVCVCVCASSRVCVCLCVCVRARASLFTRLRN